MISVPYYSLNNFLTSKSTNLGFPNFPSPSPLNFRRNLTSSSTELAPIKANEASRMSSLKINSDESSGLIQHEVSVNGRRSENIVWHKCSVEKSDRQELLKQKGCVVWITGLSGSGKSTLACALTRGLHSRGKLTYVLDGDNVRHGLNSDLTFQPEDRVENIRRIGEVAKLFSDAGVICIASVISPYRKDRDAYRAKLPEGDFIEVFMDMPLCVCEARDPKGLYKLARAGKIKGFTGVDDPYEPPLNSEIVIQQEGDVCPPPEVMAEKVISYLDANGYFEA
ncbi:putative adenylyl-sulfate kinase [Helianthus annuus]|uniref:Adenylyl-sulfate kinase n=1 Tax=Helianthus annuus TaxID=4232 RepID=A0A251S6L4_HELAN|nr:adenylyl-sulfate kinase 3 [Helianthus annuus]KAF5763634.1 putative adenylyl-sulfate kinase [Helianthus annuus]KAJ0472260.1 putative adenylyl-sulfate kinase [Helianthus annuus]KAJ0647858.1 putative adenylyl-sulfate kinase [Helianthus annuus]KAJ0651721.1 putative adenylyl-sulfate kinase [Helianthus annuus]